MHLGGWCLLPRLVARSHAAPYNYVMARGWESKSVEAQIEESDSDNFNNPDQKVSAAERQTIFKRNDLLLSRRRILQQLERSPNERYSDLLRRTLAGLDAELAALDKRRRLLIVVAAKTPRRVPFPPSTRSNTSL